MKTIQFETTIRHGRINIPSVYKTIRNSQAKVILLVDELSDSGKYDKVLLKELFEKAHHTLLFSEVIDSVHWQRQQRNDWE
jgi:hypothetical protein